MASRIATSSSMRSKYIALVVGIVGGGWREGQVKFESGSAGFRITTECLAAVGFCDLLHQSKAEAGAFRFAS